MKETCNISELQNFIGKEIAKAHLGTGCRCGACRVYGGSIMPLSKTAQKKLARKNAPQLEVCAYLPAGEDYPVLLVRVFPQKSSPVMSFQSQVVRRGDPGYEDLLAVCKDSPVWLYSQEPLPLR